MTKQLGEVCQGASECDSNACADGVCCDRACTGGCELCNATGSVGACVIRGVANKCGVECVDGDLHRVLVCDGTSAECTLSGATSTCGGAGCLVLASGKGVCAQCSATVPCANPSDACVDGSCQAQTTPVPTGCTGDVDCGRPDLACVAGACTPRQTSAFASIEPLPLDESCGCRLPGGANESPTMSAGLLAVVGLAFWGLRRRVHRRRRGRIALAIASLSILTIGAFGGSACSPQEDLPANQACLDTSIALSAAVLACTDDYDASVRIGNGFEGKYRCNATDVNDTPRYYRCPADLKALPCADVKAAGEDYDQFLGRSPACRLLFSRPDGSAIAPVAGSTP